MFRKVAVFLVLIGLLAGCSPTQDVQKVGNLEIATPWARSAAAGENTAAFMIIRNKGSEADQLIKAAYANAMVTEIHETKMIDDVMKMSPVESIEIPAKGEVELKPGGFHVMIMGLKQELRDGDPVTITLTFVKAGEVTIEMKARQP